MHSTHIPKIFNALTLDHEPRKGKWPVISISSNSSDESSYTIKSLPLKPKKEVRKIMFGDIHLEVSTNADKKTTKKDLHIHRVVSSEESEKRRTTSYKKYNL